MQLIWQPTLSVRACNKSTDLYMIGRFLVFFVRIAGFGKVLYFGFGGQEVACWPLAGSYPAEAIGFFRAKKSSVCLPSEGK
jgi:hypothetical protein